MYFIKPELWLVGLMFALVCVAHVWIWLVGKLVRNVEAGAAERRGLTPEQYHARKPNIRFDLGGWPFQKQVQGHRQDINGWVFFVGILSIIMLGKYLSAL